MTTAPYLATRTLIQSEDEKRNYTDTAEIITRDIYVDDLLTGAETAVLLRIQITRLLSSGDFNLRKWASNYPHLIEPMISAQQDEHWCLDLSKDHKTLGILWNPQRDCLLY